MSRPAEHNITKIVNAACAPAGADPSPAAAGAPNPGPPADGFDDVYAELKQLAAGLIAQHRPWPRAQTTSLVNEAMARLLRPGRPWDSRAHFFGSAARAMRFILVARARDAAAGGASKTRPERAFSVEAPESVMSAAELIDLDAALARLEQVDREAADFIHLHFFAGLTIEQTAEVLGLSLATAKRRWSFAKAWLRKEMLDRHSAAAGPP